MTGPDAGAWIAAGLGGDNLSATTVVPRGYEAYAELVHDPEATQPPGPLPQVALQSLLPILQEHTDTPDACYFGQWTVWGHLRRPTRIWTFADDAAHAYEPAPRSELRQLHALGGDLKLGDAEYRIFAAPLEAAQLLGHWRDESILRPLTPDLIWPEDHKWIVRRDGDSDSYIAGTRQLVDDLLAAPDLHVRRAQ